MDSQNNQDKQKWIDLIFQKVKEYQSKVDELEISVTTIKENYDEVLKRNKQLEEEISERTEELEKTQKGLISLQGISETMKTSEPLSSVLNIACQGLVDNLDYLFACIMQIQTSDNDKNLCISTYKVHDSFSSYINIDEDEVESYSIPVKSKTNIIIKSILSNEVILGDDLLILFADEEIEGTKPLVRRQAENKQEHAWAIVPLYTEANAFGVLVVISKLSIIMTSEKNILQVFADQIQIAVTIASLFEQIKEQAITDGLTKIYNRRFFDQFLAKESERAIRQKQPFSLITIDMDHLKLINDTYGHSAGDTAIIHLANVLKDNARAEDVAARFGGEEFCLILPGIDTEGGLIAAERIRESIENKPVEGVGQVTASIGLATFLRHTDNLGELLELADQAMYEAKLNGRNQVREAINTKIKSNWQEIALNTFIKILTEKHTSLTPELTNQLFKKLNKKALNKESFIETLYDCVDCLIGSKDTFRELGYTKKVVNYSIKLARKAGLSREEIEKIALAAVLHDLGKVQIPEEILTKPGPLSESEWEIILDHPMNAITEILEPFSSLDYIFPIVKHHHEKWNGHGYPSNLTGEDIPLGSRIIFIADSYCAMISVKPYRKALSQKEANEILMNGANKIWDGKLVELFMDILSEETTNMYL